uniref:response regulator n=1 Tax=Bosea sp. ASV33 TaxID=2795106 RepID=UPI0018EB9A45
LRDMLSPVLRASGRIIAPIADFSEAALATAGEPIVTALLDLDRDSDAAFAFAALLRDRAKGERLRILGLTTCATPDLHMRAVQAGLDDVIAKFDRRALLSELNTAGADLRHAA